MNPKRVMPRMLEAMKGQRAYSLTRRVVLLSSVWAIIATFALGWTLVGLFKTSVNDSFDELQLAQLFTLIAAVDADEQGRFRGTPDLGDANFQRPDSGWYWKIFQRAAPDNALSSASLADETINAPSLADVPLDDEFSRQFIVNRRNGELTRVLETEIALRDDVIAVFQVGGSETGFRGTISSYTRQIAGLLGTFAIGLVVINMLVILFGLRPLEQLRTAMSQIRAGKSDNLTGKYPDEIQPLADELNLLMDNNRRIVERSRTQVGNLAHSLKTPLSVLINAADEPSGMSPDLVKEQSRAMQYQIQHYLDRARIAAQQQTGIYRTNATQAAQKLVEVLAKLNPERKLAFIAPDIDIVFAGEKEDFDEIVGNLLENACKWARHRIEIVLEKEQFDEAETTRDWMTIAVNDDGPGIDRDLRSAALKRGQRMDETVPGTGLGLSIVAETVRSYGGDIVLKEATLGGLQVIVRLPALRG